MIHKQAGLKSVLNRDEMQGAERTQHAGLCWLELQVAGETAEAANQLAAAVTARRGENRLQRRRMVSRLALYRERFPDAYPPLLPTYGWGQYNALVSTPDGA